MTDLKSRLILITNDDGYNSEGLLLLEEIAKSLSDNVWIVAPEEEQSGKGHSLSLQLPVRYRKIRDKYYAVNGTPTDCVMMALHKILPKHQKPALLLSGINRGVNLAEDMTYSGTISAAMEGAICGIKSIALSQEISKDQSGDVYKTAREFGTELISELSATSWQDGVLMNINFPLNTIKTNGVKVTSQGFRENAELFINEREDLRGQHYYWIGFRRQYGIPKAGTDLAAIQDNYISLTPLHLNLTHQESLLTLGNKMNKKFR